VLPPERLQHRVPRTRDRHCRAHVVTFDTLALVKVGGKYWIKNSRTPADSAAVAAAVVLNEGRVLLCDERRRARPVLAVPAGKIAPGESAAVAAVRETREETGLLVKAVRVLGRRIHPTTGRSMIYVACRMVGGTARVEAEDEVAEVLWCARNALNDRVSGPLHPIVQRYLDADRVRRMSKPLRLTMPT
jgi:8-oxo-dGTP diphosphatase